MIPSTDFTREYDLVVLGGGPAGIYGATTASLYGKRVALVHRHHELGGADVNTGTVPSKTLRETALALSGIRARRLIGVDLSVRRETTVGDFLRHERQVKAGLNALLAQRLAAFKTDLYCGAGSFVNPHTVRVRPPSAETPHSPSRVASGEDLLHADYVLIATGSAPVHPPIFPFDAPNVYDS
ncbi:MAG TPA: FAD-dependent oxidoreductase, partial [Phycisphaerae bacterium]